MSVLRVAKLQGITQTNFEITVPSTHKLIVNGTLRANSIQNTSGITIWSPDNAGNITISGNITASNGTVTANVLTATGRVNLPTWTTATRPTTNLVNGLFGFNTDTNKGLEIYNNNAWQTLIQSAPGISADNPAASVGAILASNPAAPSGLYWINVPTLGARQIYCDMTGAGGGGWMLLMRGNGNDGVGYNDSRWTDTSESNRTNLHTNTYGEYAKDAAFYYFSNATKIRIDAGGFGGANADGSYRTFTFDFQGSNTPTNLMFTTANRMSWGATGGSNSRSTWKSTFGQDREGTPVFERFGSTANHSIGNEGRGRRGCGQPMMFGYQASDSENPGTNDVNSGLGTHPSYCGGNPAGFARGSWMGNGGQVKIWAR